MLYFFTAQKRSSYDNGYTPAEQYHAANFKFSDADEIFKEVFGNKDPFEAFFGDKDPYKAFFGNEDPFEVVFTSPGIQHNVIVTSREQYTVISTFGFFKLLKSYLTVGYRWFLFTGS